MSDMNTAAARLVTDHEVNEANKALTITALSRIGAGGAPIAYSVTGFTGVNGADEHVTLRFQDGPVDQGVNGLTHEVLLAILVDRMRALQKGPFAGRYNALALTAMEEAQNWLLRRTLERQQRGVEGTHQV